MISFACALQLQSFKKVNGCMYASTMCIGNLKSLITSVTTYIRTKKYQDIVKIHDCFLIILLFTFGAGIGGNCSKVYNEGTIWGSAVLMVICFALMAIDTNE